jgi:hypothetical protein
VAAALAGDKTALRLVTAGGSVELSGAAIVMAEDVKLFWQLGMRGRIG